MASPGWEQPRNCRTSRSSTCHPKGDQRGFQWPRNSSKSRLVRCCVCIYNLYLSDIWAAKESVATNQWLLFDLEISKSASPYQESDASSERSQCPTKTGTLKLFWIKWELLAGFIPVGGRCERCRA